jgi:hypothetical protein
VSPRLHTHTKSWAEVSSSTPQKAERRSIYRAHFYCLSKYPVTNTLQVHKRPLRREMPVSSLLLHISQIISKVSWQQNLTYPSKSPRKQHPLHGPQRGSYGERCPLPEPSFTYPSGSPVKEPSLQAPLAELP